MTIHLNAAPREHGDQSLLEILGRVYPERFEILGRPFVILRTSVQNDKKRRAQDNMCYTAQDDMRERPDAYDKGAQDINE